jgi:hypothetical protein
MRANSVEGCATISTKPLVSDSLSAADDHHPRNMGWDNYFATDEFTVLLGLIAASTFLLKSLYKPQPLVHPVLLGRQSDASHVRQAGESAIYRNYGTGMLGRVRIHISQQGSARSHESRL